MALVYLINKTATHVSVVDARFLIPRGGFLQVEQEDADHGDVVDARRKGWIEISATLPGQAQPFVPNIEFAKDEMKGSKYPPGMEPKDETVETAKVEETQPVTVVDSPAAAAAAEGQEAPVATKAKKATKVKPGSQESAEGTAFS